MAERPCHFVAFNAYIFFGANLWDFYHLGLICVFESMPVWHFIEVEPRQRDLTRLGVARNGRVQLSILGTVRTGRAQLSILGTAHLAILGTARIG